MDSRFNIYINSDEGRKKLVALQKEIDATAKKLEELRREGKANGEQAQKLQNAQEATAKAFDKIQKAAGLNALSYKELQKERQALLRQYERKIPGDPEREKLKKQLTEVSKRMADLRFNANACQNGFEKFATGIQKFWTTIVAGGAVIAGIVTKFNQLTSVIQEFESSFAKTLTNLSEAEKIEFGKQLEQGSIDIMQKYGFTIADTNNALFEAISAGIKAGDSIAFLDNAANLAVGGITNLETSVDGMTSIMNAYGHSIGEADNIANAFFTAQKDGKTTVDELAKNVGQLAPILSSVNIPYQEMLAAMSTLTLQGISTADSTTQLKGAISSLIKPSKEAEKVLRQYGVPVGATELKAAGLGEALRALNNLYNENADALALAIPNIRGFQAITALTGDTLEQYDRTLQKIYTDTSSLTDATNTVLATVERQTAKARAELQAFILNSVELKKMQLAGVQAIVYYCFPQFREGWNFGICNTIATQQKLNRHVLSVHGGLVSLDYQRYGICMSTRIPPVCGNSFAVV